MIEIEPINNKKETIKPISQCHSYAKKISFITIATVQKQCNFRIELNPAFAPHCVFCLELFPTNTHTHTHTHKDATKAIGIGRQIGREMTCKLRLPMMIMMTHCNLKGLFN